MRYNTRKKRIRIRPEIEEALIFLGYNVKDAEKLSNWWVDGNLPIVYKEDLRLAIIRREYLKFNSKH